MGPTICVTTISNSDSIATPRTNTPNARITIARSNSLRNHAPTGTNASAVRIGITEALYMTDRLNIHIR